MWGAVSAGVVGCMVAPRAAEDLGIAVLAGGMLGKAEVGILLIRGLLAGVTGVDTGGAVGAPAMEQLTPLMATCRVTGCNGQTGYTKPINKHLLPSQSQIY